MANIVELREMSADKLEEMLEDAREGYFKLRFRRASGQLDDYSRLKVARREIAQLETVLHMRRLAIKVASEQPEIAAALKDKAWEASAHFDYEESAWLIEFTDEDGNELASATVNLNKKQPKNKREAAKRGQPQLVTSYEIAG